MKKELKDAIIKAVQDNIDQFQNINYITDKFRAYIYDENGNYLIGGEEVAVFIQEFIKLYS